MKIIIGVSIAFFLLLTSFMIGFSAQSEITPIAYGDTIEGEITNQVFEWLYSFEGEKGDIVLVEMKPENANTFGPMLFITTLENQSISQEFGYFDAARVLTRLPDDDVYQIVASRDYQRTGQGEGKFTLTLTHILPENLENAWEGTFSVDSFPPLHFFYSENGGTYTVRFEHLRGDYYPTLSIMQMLEDNYYGYYPNDIASLSAQHLSNLSFDLKLEDDTLYIISFGNTYYDPYLSTAASVTYRVEIQPNP